MNYRHIYHAGNFADVVKHLLLIAVLNKVKQKSTPFAVLDSFAGIGLYNLTSDQALKTKEYDYGINLLIKQSTAIMPPLIQQYLEIIFSINNSHQQVTYYPGSPHIIATSLRASDRLIAIELHKEDIEILRTNLRPFRQTIVSHIDAYISLKAMLPFKEKRGIILLDPPFEVINEFDKLVKGVELIYKRFSQGITIIWYPIKDRQKVDNFYIGLKRVCQREILITEFKLNYLSANLNTIGLIVINPPDIILECKAVFNWLKEIMYENKASFTINLMS